MQSVHNYNNYGDDNEHVDNIVVDDNDYPQNIGKQQVLALESLTTGTQLFYCFQLLRYVLYYILTQQVYMDVIILNSICCYCCNIVICNKCMCMYAHMY